MTKPLQIYLDNKDYSRMADRGLRSGDKTSKDVYDYLFNKVHLGDIQIRVSSFNVSELIPASLEFKDAGLRRASTAKSLSRNCALIHYEDLICKDILRVCHSKIKSKPIVFNKESAYSDICEWSPKLSSSDFDMRTEMKNQLFDLVDRSVKDKNQAIKMKKKLINGNGYLTNFAQSIISPQQPEIIESLKQKYPITERLYKENMILQHCAGRVSAEEFAREMQKGMCDLENLAGWMYEFSDNVRTINSIPKQSGEVLVKAIEATRKNYADLLDVSRNLGMKDKDVARRIRKSFTWGNARSKMIRKLIEENRKEFSKFGGIERSFEAASNTKVGELPFLDSALTTMLEFAVSRSLQTVNPPELNSSDYADSMQAGYIPFVDIFSCDIRTEEFTRVLSRKYGTIIVKNFKDIPETIENALISRK